MNGFDLFWIAKSQKDVRRIDSSDDLNTECIVHVAAKLLHPDDAFVSKETRENLADDTKMPLCKETKILTVGKNERHSAFFNIALINRLDSPLTNGQLLDTSGTLGIYCAIDLWKWSNIPHDDNKHRALGFVIHMTDINTAQFEFPHGEIRRDPKFYKVDKLDGQEETIPWNNYAYSQPTRADYGQGMSLDVRQRPTEPKKRLANSE